MENKRETKNVRTGKAVDETRGGSGVKKTTSRRQTNKPEIVKGVPTDIGRHGSDEEKDLNPEE